uniref:General transcription factor 3C polypeptide 5 n=1 Tax=Peronospora matthiolae TaxID=2874970 RepID=A0AAV1TVX1_9STRA
MADKPLIPDTACVPHSTSTESISASTSVPTHANCLQPLSHELDLLNDDVRPLVGLELPVYGSDMVKVLETVSGLQSLQQAHETKNQFLPVKLRPLEPSCKPLFADLTKTQMVLLRVKRSQVRRKRSEEAAVEQTKDRGSEKTAADRTRISVQVVGLIKEKYVCEGMADFQYFTAREFYPTSKPDKDALTVVVDATEAVETAVMNSAVVENGPLSRRSLRQRELQDCLRPYLAVENETQLELIPEVFSKVDLPLKYEFRQKSGYQPTAAAKKASTTMTYLNFHDDVPAPVEPKPERPVVRRRSVGVDDSGVDAHVMEMLEEKLEQKPVWLRSKLFNGLDACERRAARRLLRKLCYVFVDGPWRGSWIKMGLWSYETIVNLYTPKSLMLLENASKSMSGTSLGNACGEGGHAKAPRIVKVTQTSALENAQASKRRRKERFTRGETRRSYLVEPTIPESAFGAAPMMASSPPAGSMPSTVNSCNDWDSEDEQEDRESDADEENTNKASKTSASANSAPGGSEKIFEIFGVQLSSANVLFQLEEIDDEEVREWTAQFAKQPKPSLLGGWYPTQMFLPLREIIRLRIAAMVGRSKVELDTRRKRLDVLKKQALAEYGESVRLASKEQQSGSASVSVPSGNNVEAAAVTAAGGDDTYDDDEHAFEQSLIEERNATSVKVEKPLVRTEAEKAEEDEDLDEDLDLQEDDDDNETISSGRSRTTYEEDETLEDDEDEEDEQVEEDATLDTQQQNGTTVRADEISESTEYSF